MSSIFAVPGPSDRTLRRGPNTSRKVPRSKRKRDQTHDEQDESSDIASPTNVSENDVEYTVVVSPAEREQRRLAAQALDQSPPPFPFPHAKPSQLKDDLQNPPGAKSQPNSSNGASLDQPGSLHLQHLAALTAVVHRCVLSHDFDRAARALGLMFRDTVATRGASLRTRGHMGIAAEVLLCQGTTNFPAQSPRGYLPFSRAGFENAKRFYERLIIQHPYHKAAPGSVNSVDFYLAMFNMWVYVAAEESRQMSERSGVGSDGGSPSFAPLEDHVTNPPYHIVRELEQASEIEARLASCMASVPYSDSRDLIRLQGMVALWVADLHEQCLVAGPGAQDLADTETFRTGMVLLDQSRSESSEHRRKAEIARELARTCFAKLEGNAMIGE